MEIKRLGNIYGFTGGSFDGNVFSIWGGCPTLRSSQSHGSVPHIVVAEIKNLGRVGGGKSQSKQVYDPQGLCPTICSRLDKGNTMPYVVDKEDNMKILGHMEENSNQRYVGYDKNEDSPTLQAAMGTGGGQTPYIAVDEQNMTVHEDVVGTLTTDGSSPKHNNRILDKIRWRIRKLTPCECFLLMDFSESDFRKAEKVNSNSQLYKQAGNSICQNVLVAALGQLFEGKEDIYKTACCVKKLEPTECDSGGYSVSDTVCLNPKGGRGNVEGVQPSVQDRVYDPQGVSTAITTAYHPNVLVKDKVNRVGGY